MFLTLKLLIFDLYLFTGLSRFDSRGERQRGRERDSEGGGEGESERERTFQVHSGAPPPPAPARLCLPACKWHIWAEVRLLLICDFMNYIFPGSDFHGLLGVKFQVTNRVKCAFVYLFIGSTL